MGSIVRRAGGLLLGAALVFPHAAPYGAAVPDVAAPIPGAVIPARPHQVLAELATEAPLPGAAGLDAALSGALGRAALGPSVAAEVVDVIAGRSLWERSATRAAVPASTAKILTAAAVLSVLDPQDRLATTVVAGAAPEQIVLVGGGDVLLAAGAGRPETTNGRAGLDDLAAATAAALTAAGRRSVSLRLDDTLFTGPAVSPQWNPGDVTGGFVAPVSALAMDAGNAVPGRRPLPGLPFPRVADPAMAAARTFAGALRRHGMTVSAPAVRGSAPPGAAVLAQVRSAPVVDLVAHALTDSDNTAAEALARLVAVRGNRPATFEGAGAAILDRVGLLGVEVAGQRLAGGSGLGRGYAVSPRTLVRVLAVAASAGHPELRGVLTGLPVAGASGTLVERFAAARPALGVVRAKTGTLTGVSSLAGTVLDADGRLLAFAVLADRVVSTEGARDGLDSAAAALARCGCR